MNNQDTHSEDYKLTCLAQHLLQQDRATIQRFMEKQKPEAQAEIKERMRHELTQQVLALAPTQQMTYLSTLPAALKQDIYQRLAEHSQRVIDK